MILVPRRQKSSRWKQRGAWNIRIAQPVPIIIEPEPEPVLANDPPWKCFYALGSQQNYGNNAVIAAHAKRDIVFFPHFFGWAQSKGEGKTMPQVCQLIKDQSTLPVKTKIFCYAIQTDIPKENASTGRAFWEPYQRALLQRGFVYTNEPTGTIIADSSYGAQFAKLNFSLNCRIGSDGMNQAQYYNRWSKKLNFDGGIISNGTFTLNMPQNNIWDGIFQDSIDAVQRNPTGDYNRSGGNDVFTSFASRSYLQQSHRIQLEDMKFLLPGKLLAVNNMEWWLQEFLYEGLANSPLNQVAHVGMAEHVVGYSNSPETYENFRECMRKVKCLKDSLLEPKLLPLEVDLITVNNYRRFRYCLGIALMNHAALYEHVGTGYRSEETPSLWWDEYDHSYGPPVAGAAGAVQTAPRYPVTGGNLNWGEGYWRIDFRDYIYITSSRRGHGIRTNIDQETPWPVQQLEAPFRRILGTRDPVHNNGQIVTSFQLRPGDGLLLERI